MTWVFCSSLKTNDYRSTPQQLKDQVCERYPGARRANLKNGGDFPFLSRPDDVNLHFQLHLRRVGVEPQPDWVRGISQDTSGSGGESSGKEEVDDAPKDDMGSSGVASPESRPPPAPETSEPESPESTFKQPAPQ